jgi:hypothetical protein
MKRNNICINQGQGRHGGVRPQNCPTPPRLTTQSEQQLYSGEEFEQLGLSIMGRAPNGSNNTKERRFFSHFGLKAGLVSIVWRELAESNWLQLAGRKAKPEHLLWCLLFLNNYSVEEVNAAFVHTSERTFREKVWFYAEGIVQLDRKLVSFPQAFCLTIFYSIAYSTIILFCNQIRWENRFEGNTGERCLVTVNGVDFEIQEPTNFSSQWFSHKSRGPGLRYEMAVCIQTGKIVAYNGPFECGSWPDLQIFRSKLKCNLGPGEKVVADRGYRGDDRICTPDEFIDNQHRRAMSVARA